MEWIELEDADAHTLKALVARIESGVEAIYLGRDGKAVAKLVRYEAAEDRVGGQLRGKIRIAEDFDELPPDIAAAFGMNPG